MSNVREEMLQMLYTLDYKLDECESSEGRYATAQLNAENHGEWLAYKEIRKEFIARLRNCHLLEGVKE